MPRTALNRTPTQTVLERSEALLQPIWRPHPGPQMFALSRYEEEILYGGARGGGKTDAGLAWFTRWTHMPKLRGLVLRRNADDLYDWIDRAQRMYAPLGAVSVGKPAEFRFPSGARIRCGHLKDEDAFEKYQGHEYQKMLIEELTQIESFDSYQKLLASNRSTVPGLKAQMFCTTNPGGPGHCVPFGDVLTPSGWKPIQDIQVGAQVLTQDEQGIVRFMGVEQTTIERYHGPMIYSDNYASKFVCTPNHRIARVTETKNKEGRTFHDISLVQAKDLARVTRLPKLGAWVGSEIGAFTVPQTQGRTVVDQPSTITGDQFCELMGWFLSEGCVVNRDAAFSIAQEKPLNRLKIADLLTRCGFRFSEGKSQYTVYSRKWFTWFVQFGKSRDKFVPKEILNTTPRQLRIFWEAAMAGDGCKNVYYTISKQLADDMQEIGLKLGFRTSTITRQRKNRRGLSYEVSFKENKIGWIEKDNLHEEEFDGLVYCLGIPQVHRFFLRQNGTVWLSGNSWVRERWHIEGAPNDPVSTFDKGTDHRLIFVPAKVEDNPTLMQNDPQYVKFLDGLTEDLRKAWRDGSWDVFAGQFFTEWDARIHVVDPFEIPGSWARFRSIDPGGRHGTTSCHWYAVDHDSAVWVYRELYATGTDADQNAATIRDMSRNETYRWTVIDSAAFHKLGLPETTAEVYIRNGVDGLVPASKNRMEGWDAVHRYLRPQENGAGPRLRIFRTCPNMIRTIPLMLMDERNMEDIVQGATVDDHAVDELRYLLQTFRDQGVVRPLSYTERYLQSLKKRDRINLDRFKYRR